MWWKLHHLGHIYFRNVTLWEFYYLPNWNFIVLFFLCLLYRPAPNRGEAEGPKGESRSSSHILLQSDRWSSPNHSLAKKWQETTWWSHENLHRKLSWCVDATDKSCSTCSRWCCVRMHGWERCGRSCDSIRKFDRVFR